MKGLTDVEFEALHRRVTGAPWMRMPPRAAVTVKSLVERGCLVDAGVALIDGLPCDVYDLTSLGRLAYRCELAVRGVRTT